MRLLVELRRDRAKQGTVTLFNDVGPLAMASCLAKADNAAARAHANPTRDPNKPFGDTPLGTFTARVVFFPAVIDEHTQHSYGPYGWVTWNVGNRISLGLHGGDPGPAGRLRPTFGCVRTTNEFMRKLMDALKATWNTDIKIEIREVEEVTS